MNLIRNEWVFSNGSLGRNGWATVVDEAIPGWNYTGLRIGQVDRGLSLSLDVNNVERLIVPLEGSFTVQHGSGDSKTSTLLRGRKSVFEGPTDVLYLSVLSSATISGRGRFAVAAAPATTSFPDQYVPAEHVQIELRGAGNATRQVHNFGVPGSLNADRLIVCEVITPSGNWSSYPPHKHDTSVPRKESRLEEIYYFEAAVSRSARSQSLTDPFGLMRAYSSDAGEIDTMAEVRTGDVALVPFGWHGPCVAAPGYDLYYLNVMAGPDPERAWLITDDPSHAWVRRAWRDEAGDRRLPYSKPIPSEAGNG